MCTIQLYFLKRFHHNYQPQEKKNNRQKQYFRVQNLHVVKCRPDTSLEWKEARVSHV